MKKKNPNKITRKQFLIFIVCITTGIIIGYSYKLSKDETKVNTSYLEQEESYRNDLIVQQERNKELFEELNELKNKIFQYEKTVASDEDQYKELVEEAEQLRLLLGEMPAEGEGIKVTLKDSEYQPNLTNPNEYIVHESHIFMVINELKISGAQAIAINGQRLKPNSYISCNGPVITIDGKQFPAPFEIEAIGNKKTLVSSLKIVGGIFDQLINDRIVVTIEEKDFIQMSTVNET